MGGVRQCWMMRVMGWIMASNPYNLRLAFLILMRHRKRSSLDR